MIFFKHYIILAGKQYFIVFTTICVIGLIFTRLIEYPNELFFNTTVHHTVDHYSYEPGQQGSSYEFFRKIDNETYKEIVPLVAILIATLFYTVIPHFLFILLSLILNNKNWNKLIKAEEEQNLKKKNYTIAFVLNIIVIAIIFYLGNNFYS